MEKLIKEKVEYGTFNNGMPYKKTTRNYSIEDETSVSNIKEPSFKRKVFNFSLAYIKHLFTGRHNVDLETIQKRYEICKSCPLYRVRKKQELLSYKPLVQLFNSGVEIGTCTHRSCGCFIHDKMVFPNKLSWADQKCPKNKWGPVGKGRLVWFYSVLSRWFKKYIWRKNGRYSK